MKPDQFAELDQLATEGLGPRWRLSLAALREAMCPVCHRPESERCTGNKTHDDRVWLYAARLRREKHPLPPTTIVSIRQGLDQGDEQAHRSAVAWGLLRLATGPDGVPRWVRTKALEEAGKTPDETDNVVGEVRTALIDAGMVDGIRVSAINSPDIVQIEAGDGHYIRAEVDGQPITAQRVVVHECVKGTPPSGTPTIPRIARDIDAMISTQLTVQRERTDIRAALNLHQDATHEHVLAAIERGDGAIPDIAHVRANQDELLARNAAWMEWRAAINAYIARGDDQNGGGA